ncbi:helicase HerA domain-containing protein [Sphingomonas profundi]|uniref:helicase HerA domain-containing protein n=1 Tax=Alterirhizorhabdus profundi TaxID=2681549 RepID=UPI0012E86A69|nr:ATP-binding protein [Sphingomonas profundi]
MTVSIDMGIGPAGKPALLDLEELLATRLLVQGNSGSGKSHLLRRLIEGSAPWVQQVVIDPEGDFVTLADRFGHVAVEAADYSEGEIARVAARIRAHRASVVLNLEGLEIDAQMKCAAAFLAALFDAPREQWYPVLVVVDEAQLFAPAVAGEVSEDARKASLAAMTNLMCRGRKRGLAGVIATQRLAKLAKNVAAEASNFLMGRTFLDIDMLRAADLLGMERRQAEQIRDLERGHFLALGPALSRRPLAIRIGDVETGARSASPRLMPLPQAGGSEMQDLLFGDLGLPAAAPPPPPAPVPADELIRGINRPVFGEPSPEPLFPLIEADERETKTAAVLRDIVADAEATYRTPAQLYQDFGVRCRMRGLAEPPLDLTAFKRRLAMARAGEPAGATDDPEWAAALAMADDLPEDMLGVFLLIARAARDGRPCPSDEEVARVYGTHSLGRTRRLIGYMEARGILVPRTDMRGRRAIGIPRLGWTTAAGDPASMNEADAALI